MNIIDQAIRERIAEGLIDAGIEPQVGSTHRDVYYFDYSEALHFRYTIDTEEYLPPESVWVHVVVERCIVNMMITLSTTINIDVYTITVNPYAPDFGNLGDAINRMMLVMSTMSQKAIRDAYNGQADETYRSAPPAYCAGN